MQRFSAIVLDIDGTLLNSQGRLSEPNLLALRECAQRDILLYVATARPPRLVFRPREAPGDVSFLLERGIFYNGALAIDNTLGYSRHWPMSAGLVKAVTGYLADAVPDLNIAIQNRDEYHSFRLPMDESDLISWGFSQEELLPFSEACGRECSKIVAWHRTRELLDVYHGIIDGYSDSINAFLTDSGRWLQLMAGEASKERALLDMLSLRGIAPDELMVFGDDMPDAGMFRTFGCSIAMGNAPKELRDTATYVTRSNDDDGVAFALRKYLGNVIRHASEMRT
jgi:Cof subfamily protein (haloacid dehalogenase superfamily)